MMVGNLMLLIFLELYGFIKGVLNGDEPLLGRLSTELAGLRIDETDDELISYISERARGILHS